MQRIMGTSFVIVREDSFANLEREKTRRNPIVGLELNVLM